MRWNKNKRCEEVFYEKTYVLDNKCADSAPMRSNVLRKIQLVLPMTVLEELDNNEKEEGEKDANVRKVIRILDATQRKRKFAGRGAYGMGRDSACRKKITGTLNCLRIFRNINLIIAF